MSPRADLAVNLVENVGEGLEIAVDITDCDSGHADVPQQSSHRPSGASAPFEGRAARIYHRRPAYDESASH